MTKPFVVVREMDESTETDTEVCRFACCNDAMEFVRRRPNERLYVITEEEDEESGE